ncbi:MAG: hypothetical protein ACOC38_12365, partial [Promethearchaeia archaeon]
ENFRREVRVFPRAFGRARHDELPAHLPSPTGMESRTGHNKLPLFPARRGVAGNLTDIIHFSTWIS